MTGEAADPLLPVLAVTGELSRRLDEAFAAVLCAPPGSGKTTQVAPALLDAPWLRGQRIVMLEPRRVAARAAAHYMAARAGEKVGETVGFRVRFESVVGARTRIEVVTEGVLVQMLQRDPELGGVGLVIFDEFHERSLECDLSLALTLDVRRAVRRDLRVLVMSATLDAAPVARLLGGAPVIEAQGRPYPVTVEYQEREGAVTPARVAAAVRRALASCAGDVLVFLPGAPEIHALGRELGDLGDTLVRPLYGGLPAAEQDLAVRPDAQGKRRVVLATNIAETSLTIEGVGAVVDSGLARRPRFAPNTGLSRLQTFGVSKSSAAQRAGRAGRTGPGTAYRLWAESAHARRPEHEAPAIMEADLAGFALELALWGVTSPEELKWLDPPPRGAYGQAIELLEGLGALDADGHITAVGRRMSEFPLHPRIARMLVAAQDTGDAAGRALGADLAATLEGALPAARDGAGVDVRDRVEALERYRARRDSSAAGSRALAAALRAATQLRAIAGVPQNQVAKLKGAGRILLAGYPDRLAQRRGGRRGRFRLVGGRGLKLAEADPLSGSEYLVVPALDAGTVDAKAYSAAPVTQDDIYAVLGGRIGRRRHVGWDTTSDGVETVDQEHVGEVVLQSTPARNARPYEIVDATLEGVMQLGLGVLPWTPVLRQICARVDSLRQWQPEAGWPEMGEQRLLEDAEEWLAPFLAGITRKSQLQRVNLEAALRMRIPERLRARLDADAPSSITAPGGSKIVLEYRPGESPVLAVRLQEMFGCTRTPAVCEGRVPVQVHLLSPAMRPVHVTQDLESFWRNVYPEVRKEMRGEYPKHHWPEDPMAATPTRDTVKRR